MSELWLNDATHHSMCSHVIDGKYVALYWPKGIDAFLLNFCKEVVGFQLDTFIKIAMRAESGPIEYDSWFPPKRDCCDPWFAAHLPEQSK